MYWIGKWCSVDWVHLSSHQISVMDLAFISLILVHDCVTFTDK